MEIALSVLFLLGVPALLKWQEDWLFIKWLGAIAWCYLFGILVSFIELPVDAHLIKEVSEAAIALSVAILVLSSSFEKFRQLAGPMVKAFLLGIVSLITAIFILYFSYGNSVENGATILAMLTGVYVGGTPNLNAIGLALGIDPSTLVLVNTAEFFFGGIYFLLLLTLIKPLLSLFLRKYTPVGIGEVMEEQKIPFKLKVIHITLSLLTGIGILGLSMVLSQLLFGEMNVAFFLIALTTLSLGVGQTKPIRRIQLKFETADYLLLVFSFGIGTQIDISSLFSSGLEIYALVGLVLLTTLLIHFFLAWLFKMDTDSFIISSTAALYGPPFIGPVAKAIGNRDLVIYGITLGLLGYVIGNYLGLAMGALLGFFS